MSSPEFQSEIGRAATMRMIAEKLNISVATVSRALRRIPTISARTRAQVMQAAAEIGYALPKNFRTNPLEYGDSLPQIGVFIETPRANVSAPYLIGMSEAAMNLNASLVIHHVQVENTLQILDPQFQPPAMRAGLLAGLVLVFRWPEKVVQALSRMMPIVSITHRYHGVDHDLIGIDNQAGIEMLVQHLYNLGHRKIGFLGCCSELYWANVRFGCYVAALKSVGLEYRNEWAIDADLEALTDLELPWDRYTRQVERLVREGVRAWICVAEPVAHALHAWLTSHGLRVPEDVSITGFHRPDFVPATMPSLTSVSASYEALGAAAMKRLMYRIKNPAEFVRTILFPCEFYPGKSTGVLNAGPSAELSKSDRAADGRQAELAKATA